jgi:hypothetical protein
VAKHLILSPGQTWKLPAGTDLNDLKAQISERMINGGVAYVTIEMQDDPEVRGILLINGRAVGAAAIVEDPEEDE